MNKFCAGKWQQKCWYVRWFLQLIHVTRERKPEHVIRVFK